MAAQSMQSHTPNRKHSAKISAWLSLLFMGLGQIYNRQYVKGAFFAIVELITLIVWRKRS
ncbi:hypothetical protein [Caldalkalibacillus mannanilyticus]|uniref:hypothetical protein n=1 Tax=Caldalkalibacillus mannanilyticus TaxID=1418 RepID=UPI001F3F8DF3|nr:hypothetical protein [Caldalkalibacillus mannanilyticus]